MSIRRYSPFGEMLSLRQAMDRLFEDSFIRPRSWEDMSGSSFPLDVYSEGDDLVIEAALPGVKPDDVDITVSGDALTISAKSANEKRDEREGYLYREIRSGSYTRTVALSSDLDVERAKASFDNGILRLSIPKAERAKPRQIKIAPGGQTAGAGVTAGGGSSPSGGLTAGGSSASGGENASGNAASGNGASGNGASSDAASTAQVSPASRP